VNRPAAALALLLAAAPAGALEPADVFLVVNANEPASRELAEYYCKKRGVPKGHIVALDLPTAEDISRRDYDARLAGPLRERLKGKKDHVKVLLTVYGVPLRVGGTEPSAAEKKELDKVRADLAALRKKKADLDAAVKRLEEAAKKDQDAAAKDLAARRDERSAVERQIRAAEGRERWLAHVESKAAVDSELALLWHPPYELRRWQINPLYFQVPADVRAALPPVVMTCRLDGPGPAVVRRMINDALKAEAKGLSGTAYFDARGADYDPKRDTGHGYGGYDESLREAAQLLKEEGKLPVVLDNRGELFAPGSCPDCALYCGWYSHARFIDCCRFVPGAVAYHIASSEATTLRDPRTNVWCPRLLMAGACATLGPVAEPYTIGFPKPAEFFGFLEDGAVHELDDDAGGRPALQPVRQGAAAEARAGAAQPQGRAVRGEAPGRVKMGKRCGTCGQCGECGSEGRTAKAANSAGGLRCGFSREEERPAKPIKGARPE
jgi:uncharacterized protein (TIGR03790 family)